MAQAQTNVNSTVHASEPSFELHTLGWKAFQQLCVSIIGDVLGQTVQGYLDSRDGGRDGAFYGKWVPSGSEIYEGSFTVQCKFTSKPNRSLQLSDLRDELHKVSRLASRGLCDNYFLFTNCTLTGITDEAIRSSFESVPNLKHCLIYGSDRISQFIRESPRLRMLVPRVYGLGDLSTILDERALAQSKEILSSLGDDLQKFVITDAYRRSTRALVDHGLVMLLGEPACGKSAIATALAMGALDEWRCSTFKIRDADELVRHSNPHDPKQFFWIDDLFGVTQLDYQSAINWNRALPHINAAIGRGAKFVFTSRDYIYRNAKSILKESALPLLRNAQVVITVEDITQAERQQILYNHIRLGTQPKAFKESLKPHLEVVSDHPGFKPEIARRLGSPAFTGRLSVTATGVRRFVEKPVEFLQEVIRTLDVSSRSAIALVFMRGGSLESPVSLSAAEETALSMLGGQTPQVRAALDALRGSILLLVQEGGRFWWRFKHPSIRDAFADLVAENRELMDIYLAGTPLSQLVSEITCGDMKYQGVKVIVPPDRYPVIITRVLSELSRSRDTRSRIVSFLSHRCDVEFLVEFVKQAPQIVTSLEVGAYLYAVSDVDLIVALNDANILPEAERRRHIEAIKEVVITTPDSGFTDPGIRRLFKSNEYDRFLSDLRASIVDSIDDCLSHWHSAEGADSGSDYYDELVSALEGFEKVFPNDTDVASQVKRALSKIGEWIAELADRTAPDCSDIKGLRDTPASVQLSHRSIFDDVDD